MIIQKVGCLPCNASQVSAQGYHPPGGWQEREVSIKQRMLLLRGSGFTELCIFHISFFSILSIKDKIKALKIKLV